MFSFFLSMYLHLYMCLEVGRGIEKKEEETVHVLGVKLYCLKVA